ncbi:hypothetical protein LTR37_018087 [Vermiconidia calcicola]|uniref:Uncharacterized protein n=1 Tax=Vermiconidia calcicola TaxID=1690605 RepID=A0ACC3MI12_9PEZI|nr:hypothetical protein LTR37_018087 [Vermiconidia calcicola]
MADRTQAAVSFDDIIQEGRKKRQAEKLAQEIFGKGRRSSAPPTGPKGGLGGSLASRVGVTKQRTPSLPRPATPRQPRQPPHLSKPPAQDAPRPRPSYTQSFSGPASDAKSNGYAVAETANGGGGISFKGAASGPHTVVAQNFAPGTTAADIESVMLDAGGPMTSCRLVASNPTVIAEMVFTEKSDGDKVIDTFNGKKADGRPLYVYWKSGGGSGGAPKPHYVDRRPAAPVEPQTPALGAGQAEDVVMEVDDVTESREAENRLREERRGRDDRDRRDVFPTGPRDSRPEMDYYDRRPRRSEPGYQDGRYGFAGRGGAYGERGGRGRYPRDEGRRYGGQSWRP